MDVRTMTPAIGKWAGRATALLAFLFWGGFFVEHLTEWFLRPGGRFPPPWVWAGQALHLAMLIGLALMIKWDKLGAAVTVIASVAFFLTIGVWPMPFCLMNLVPIACFTVYWLAR